MLATSRSVADGETVAIHLDPTDIRAVVMKAGTQLACKVGVFQHNDIIGQPFGTTIAGRPNSKTETVAPTLQVLKMTPELWMACVTHRTQIIYMTDAAVITQLLRLKPGSVVAEAGTGSGSLTHVLARAVAPHGRVHTFDFHKHRAEEAQKEFAAHGIDSVVSSNWGDVCRPEGSEEGEADAAPCGYRLPAASVDAVFLDVPAPWLAVVNVMKVLREGGMLCTFSPCIEQTEKLCAAVRETSAFVELVTVEALTSEYLAIDVGNKRGRDELKFKPKPDGKGHSAFLTFAQRRKTPPTAA